MDIQKVAAPQRSRKPSCPSCARPMYAHRGRFLCTCGRVNTPGRLNLAKHLQAAEELEQTESQLTPVCLH